LAFLAFIIIAALLLWGLSDRWWAATTLLFGPRWILLLPLGLLVPAALAWDRALLLPLALSALIGLGPIMGFRTGWRSLVTSEDPDRDLRVVTFNAWGGEELLRTPINLLADWDADVAAFQECGRSLREELAALEGWHVRAQSTLCLASRLEIGEVREMDREAFEFAGGSGLVVTYELASGEGTFHLTNLHLDTPRAGFELIRSGQLAEGAWKTEEKSFLRDAEMRRARMWVDQFEGPHLVLGDFNTPPESRSYRSAWSDWKNAFSRVGRGFGGTRLNGWIRVRIDHIVANDDWEVVHSHVGRDVGSDHLPMMATVRLR
jgi:endonuclease/exonuclease/phosphatase (EEP) superfamily protein YafD